MKQNRGQTLAPTLSSSVALARLRRWLPRGVVEVLKVLQQHRARGVIVGGVVRDAFLGRRGNDWDVATDALPPEVAAMFKRVVRAGEKHGTIMVLGMGPPGPVEVTTFRSEGPYIDGRRPTHVHFLSDLRADLGRRDFTINAMAADMSLQEIVDPFGGIGDLGRRQIRAVGDPEERFSEDGLRPLRGARFAATLGFSLEPHTAAALGSALDTFRRVAWERKREEMVKLLGGRSVLTGLEALQRSGLLHELSAELCVIPVSQLHAMTRIDAEEPWLRFAAWCCVAGLSAPSSVQVADRWRASNDEKRLVGQVVKGVQALGLGHGAPPPSATVLRRWLADVGRFYAPKAAVVAEVLAPVAYRGLAAKVRRVLRSDVCLSVNELAVGGSELLSVGLRGAQIGQVQRQLLELVLAQPSKNRKDVLLTWAHKLSTGNPNEVNKLRRRSQ